MPRSLFPPNPRHTGHEPDYRFSFANERTFLAWIRTSLALSAGGLAVVELLPQFVGRDVLGILLLVLGFLTAATSCRRGPPKDRALRRAAPFPASRLPRLLAAGVAVVGLAAASFLLVDRLS